VHSSIHCSILDNETQSSSRISILLRLLFDILNDVVQTADFMGMKTVYYSCTLSVLNTTMKLLLGLFNDLHITEFGEVSIVEK
jgi:hypothetical protein